MPDISLLNKDSVATAHSDVDELEVDTQDGGTTKYVSEHLILEQKQSDWNQTDDTQVDFIKNKPDIPQAYVHPATHPFSMITGAADVASSGEYADLQHKPFDDLKTIFEDRTSKFELDDGIYGSNFIDTIEIFEGEQYRVTWDGSEHLCTCKRLYETTFLWLGNLAVFFTDAEDTGEPFLVSETGILTADSSETHTYSIVPVNTVKKIDSKYLPDMGSGLPDVTAADDGKVLGVVNGSPRWVENSWEDIQDKPFYEESVISQTSFDPLPTVTFDGVGYTWWKCSDLVLTREQILETTILTTFAPGAEYVEYVEVPQETDIVVDEENFTGVLFASGSNAGYIFCRATGEHTVSFAGNPVTFTCPETGVYLAYPVGQTPPTTVSVGIGYKDVKTLDAKYLPMDAIGAYIDGYIADVLRGEY